MKVYEVRATLTVCGEKEEVVKMFSNLKKAYAWACEWVGRQSGSGHSYQSIARKIAKQRGAGLGGTRMDTTPGQEWFELGTTYAFIWQSEVE